MPYPHPEPLSLWQSTADSYLHRRCSNTALSQSLWGPCVLVCTRFVWALWASLAGIGFDSKHKFFPPTISLGLLLCPWTWGISSQMLQCLPSYWGFSDLGHGVSIYSCSSEAQGLLLTLDVGNLLLAIAPDLGLGVSPLGCSPLQSCTAIIIFYFWSGYWLWKLINIFYTSDYATITHLIPLYHDWST